MMKRLLLPTLLFAIVSPMGLAKNLYVNSQEYVVDTLVYKHRVGPGVEYAYYRLPARPMDIYVLETDLTNPYVQFEVWNGGDKAVGGQCPSDRYAKEDRPGHDMIAAHNGDFYTTANGEAGMSRMGLVGASEIIFNPTGQPLVVVDGHNRPYIDYVNFSGTLTAGGASTRIHTVNQLRLEWEPATQANQLSLFTPAFGTALHYASTGGKVATIVPVAGSATFPANKSLAYRVIEVTDNPGGYAIPTDGAVLYGVGSSADFLGQLSAGQEIMLNLGASMPSYPDVTEFREAVGGSGHIILRNGQLCNINNPDLHPRTFMGINEDGTKLYHVVVDGRYINSAGIDLDDEGRVLQWLGAWHGLNLDGGGSTCMVVNGDIVNRTSDGAERAVGNGVILYSTAPVDDAIAEISFEPRAYYVPVNASFRPAIYGYNKYGVVKSRNLEDVTLTCDPELGYINEYGSFVANPTPARGYIYATYGGGITARQEVFTTMSDLALVYENYVVDNRGEYPVRMNAPAGRFTYDVDPGGVEWTSADPGVANVRKGWVRGVSNGKTVITGIAANFSGSVTVTTEIATAKKSTIFGNMDASTWTIKQTGGKNIAISHDGAQGFNITYTGNGSSRGAYIQATPAEKMTTYSLPTVLELDVNPGQAPVSTITTSWENAHGDHATLQFNTEDLPQDQLSTLRVDLSTLFDVKDNSCYPVKLAYLRMGMGASKSGQEFKISLPRFEQVYEDVDAVRDVTADMEDADGPTVYYNLQGMRIDRPAAGQVVIRQQGHHASKTLVR